MLTDTPTEDIDLSEMTKAELLKYAKENNISGVNNQMNKADIYDVILDSET